MFILHVYGGDTCAELNQVSQVFVGLYHMFIPCPASHMKVKSQHCRTNTFLKEIWHLSVGCEDSREGHHHRAAVKVHTHGTSTVLSFTIFTAYASSNREDCDSRKVCEEKKIEM